MKKMISTFKIVAATIGFGVVGFAGPASAAKPVVQGCVGQTFSQAGAHPLGQLIKQFAQSPDGQPGLGDGIQTLQAGQLPDEVAPNTCNG